MRIKTSNGSIIDVDKIKHSILLMVLNMVQIVERWSLSIEMGQGLLH